MIRMIFLYGLLVEAGALLSTGMMKDVNKKQRAEIIVGRSIQVTVISYALFTFGKVLWAAIGNGGI